MDDYVFTKFILNLIRKLNMNFSTFEKSVF